MLRQKVLYAALAIGIGIVLAAAVGASPPKPVAEPPAAKEIRAVLNSQVQAWNRKDMDGFMQGYWHSPDLTFFSGGIEVSGWESTIERYREHYLTNGNEMGTLEFANMKIELLGPSAAFVRGRFRLKKSNVETEGLFTLTFKKFPSGWKIIHDHTSTN
jgi:ketosteroid isomerase-like protein